MENEALTGLYLGIYVFTDMYTVTKEKKALNLKKVGRGLWDGVEGEKGKGNGVVIL